MSNHIIHSQKMMLTIESQQDWAVVQEKVGDFCRKELPQLFNSVFDQVTARETIRIKKMTLNLGDIPINKFTEALKDQILSQLLNQLKEYKINHANDSFTLNKDQLKLFKNAGKFTRGSIQKVGKVSNQIETHIDDFEALVYYCETGTRPWWISSATLFKPARIVFNLYQYDILLFSQFIRSVEDNVVVFNRMKQLINRSMFFGQYLTFTEKDDLLKFFKSQAKPSLFKKMVDYWLTDFVLAESETYGQKFSSWLIGFVEKNPQENSEIVLIVDNYLNKSAAPKRSNINALSEYLKSAETQNDRSLKPQLIKIKKQTTVTSKNIELSLESLMVNNAGLIIIHPFIKTLFKTLGWINNDAFIDELSRHRAIVYLHYFIFNEYPEDECQLLLNKILCGTTPETVIDLNQITFSDQELLEAEELKKAVISHWNALGSTSIEGLTDTFLVRNGSLNFKDGNWNLNVEKKGFDVLLEKLPWGITMIKFPWNNYLIQVNW